ncbi:MAG: hypothetical protein JWR35_1494 [Marmoricola sp.]|jgi:drug/metabolite transporter (DMT)-like permease|nr:hypothetical protein [Marmoricola sp.]
MLSSMLIGLLCAAFAAILYGLTSVLQAIAVRRLPDPGDGLWPLAKALVTDVAMVLVVVIGLIGWGLHLVAIKYLPLYLVQAVIAASLVVTAVTSVLYLRERLTPRHWAAAAAACGGLALLALASGDAGHGQFTTNKTVALYVGAVAITLAGLVAVRRPEPAGGIALAWLSGLAYAGIPLATRALTESDWDVSTLLAAATVGLYGLLGFWLYSVALQRITATASTAPLVLAETVVPAILGVVWLGDNIRQGWAVVAVAGLVISLVGVLGLADVQTIDDPALAPPS